MTVKNRILDLLEKKGPMLSLDMARVLKIGKGSASQAAKELCDDGFIHITEWVNNPKNGGNKLYAYGKGINAKQPETQIERQLRINAEKIPEPSKAEKIPEQPKIKLRPPVVHTNIGFVPRPDVAAEWLRNPI